MKPLFTIGHGTRKAEEFLSLLQKFNIKYLLDVRSRPYSRFNPQYNQKALQQLLEANNITYVFMGDALGGRPDDKSVHDIEGKVDYRLLKEKPYFNAGIERVRTALEKDLDVAVMCSERKPSGCHRSKLIGEVLFSDGIILNHIDDKGELIDQRTVMNETGNLWDQP